MSKKLIQVVWWLFALFSISFSTLALLRARGMHPISDPFGVLDHRSTDVAALAVPLEIISNFLVLLFAYLWSIRFAPGQSWARRVPLLPFFSDVDVDASTLGGKMFQGSILAVFVIAPFALLLIMCVQYLMGDVYYSVVDGQTLSLNITWWAHFDTVKLYRAAEARGGAGYFVFGSERGVQYYPVLTWVYAIAVFGLTLFLARIIWLIRRGANASSRPRSPL